MMVPDRAIGRALMLKQITHDEAVDCYIGFKRIRSGALHMNYGWRNRYIRKLVTGEFSPRNDEAAP